MKADLHIHTNFSKGCHTSPEEAVDAALVKGLNYIAIADYNTTEGAERAREYARGKGIVVLIGQEIDCREGKVIAINIQKELPAGTSVHDIVHRIHKQGGFAVAPHPFAGNGIGFLAFTNSFDCVEVSANNIHGQKKVDALCKKFGMPLVASSGAHNFTEIGRYGIEFSGDIFDCLVEGKFKIYGTKLPMNKVLFLRIKSLLGMKQNGKQKEKNK